MKASLAAIAVSLLFRRTCGLETSRDNLLTFSLAKSWTFVDDASPILLLSNTSFGTEGKSSSPPPLSARSIVESVIRRKNLVSSDLQAPIHQQSLQLDLQEIDIIAPDVTDRSTLLNLAFASWDAYHPLPDSGTWYALEGFNWTMPFGWKPDEDGLRGHLFLSQDNSSGLIVFKGTSVSQWVGNPSAKTGKRDRMNDNLLASCCCASISWRVELGHPCDCNIGGNKCCSSCLTESLQQNTTYYSEAAAVVSHFLEAYPNTSFWLTGHSLGGTVASLMGLRFSLPTVTFEALGERLAATRLHLISPSDPRPVAPIIHVFNNVDPLALGTCNGALSVCAQAGYALESKCRVGKVIVYDVQKEGYQVPLLAHRMEAVLTVLRNETREVPEAVEQVDCVDCSQWEYGEYPKPVPGWKKLWRKLRKLFGDDGDDKKHDDEGNGDEEGDNDNGNSS